MEKHISHYFESVKNLFKRSSTSLEQMRNELARQSCPKDRIDSVINGFLKDWIQTSIAKESTELSKLYDELHSKVTGITTSHIDKLLEYMVTQDLIRIIDSKKVYNLKISIPNLPIDLN